MAEFEGQFLIPTPKGVYQEAGDTNINVNYAFNAHNIRTEHGLMASAYGTSVAFPPIGGNVQIETIARFYRRNMPEAADVFVAAAAGGIYTITEGETEWTLRRDGLASNRWSYVNYEALDGGQMTDILIMSNALDGMIVIYGSDLRVENKALTIGEDFREVKFAELGRYAERIWGTGAVGYPDSLFYSKPYNPFDWTDVPDTPEIGGGMIQQPTWDGDAFLSIENFGDYLLAIKTHTVFEIRGTDPSTFTISQAFGSDGPLLDSTVCVDKMSMFYLARHDIGLYDGSTLRFLSRDALYQTMRMMDENSYQTACACMCNHVYYLALAVKERPTDIVLENNTVIEYDTDRHTFMIRKGMRVKSFYSLNGIVYYTDAAEPYDVKKYNDPDALGYCGEPFPAYWESPWLDLGKSYIKSDFEFRFTADADDDNVPILVSVETEKRQKKKVVMLQSDRRDYRVKIHMHGQRVKVKVFSGNRPEGWRIYGGIQVRYSIEEDQ